MLYHAHIQMLLKKGFVNKEELDKFLVPKIFSAFSLYKKTLAAHNVCQKPVNVFLSLYFSIHDFLLFTIPKFLMNT